MLWKFRFLPFLLLISATALAQSGLTIDKVGKEQVSKGDGTKIVAFTSVIEGVVTDPAMSVYVLVKAHDAASERAFAATVDSSQPESSKGYRWRAVCQFGELIGDAGGLYEARAVAISNSGVQRGKLLETLQASKIKSDVINLSRGNN